MRLWRVLALDRTAEDSEPGGALWFPRELQGAGRHDNPELYGCLYASQSAASAVAEQLAPFRGGGRLASSMLMRFGLPLAVAEFELGDGVEVVDLDEPSTLVAEGLRPSQVATRRRTTTQLQAAEIHAAHPASAAIRWWSTLESSWINWTVFDRAGAALSAVDSVVLETGSPVVQEAADLLGLTVAP